MQHGLATFALLAPMAALFVQASALGLPVFRILTPRDAENAE